jgi:hypothetical protein
MQHNLFIWTETAVYLKKSGYEFHRTIALHHYYGTMQDNMPLHCTAYWQSHQRCARKRKPAAKDTTIQREMAGEHHLDFSQAPSQLQYGGGSCGHLSVEKLKARQLKTFAKLAPTFFFLALLASLMLP